MSKFLKIVSSQNFISTTEKDEIKQIHNSKIQNDQMDTISEFKQLDIKEFIAQSSQPQIVIANMLF